jgi:hypothetical protein
LLSGKDAVLCIVPDRGHNIDAPADYAAEDFPGSSEMLMDLKTEVAKFKKWAVSEPQDYGEWEMDYPEWSAVYTAVEETLSQPILNDGDVSLLLYILARDNECEFILDMLGDAPEHGLRLAEAAFSCLERDARWQAAVFLGRRSENEAKDLLRQFINDEDEYVRRRALLAISQHDSVFAEETAWQWIDSPHDFSRLAALSVLQDLQSPRLKKALERLREDPFESVREKVVALSEKG